jgi:chemotaxis protein CheD
VPAEHARPCWPEAILPACAAHLRTVVRLGPGECRVSSDPDEIIATVLGSCVAACIHDPVAGIGGVNHFMLPTSPDGTWGKVSASMRYGNFAMEQLINQLLVRGGQRSRFQVKVFGGAGLGFEHADIGARNARFAEEYLRAEGMHAKVHEVGGARPRRVLYVPTQGRAFVSELQLGAVGIAASEERFRHQLRTRPVGGTVELFD